jgi:Tfp pilus assembly protein PilZ
MPALSESGSAGQAPIAIGSSAQHQPEIAARRTVQGRKCYVSSWANENFTGNRHGRPIMSDDSNSRRRQGRFCVKSEATRVVTTLTEADGTTTEVRGQLADMSRQGVRIDVNRRLVVGQEIDLRIEVPSQSLTIRRSAIVRWQQPRDATTWWTGCELTEPLSEETIEQLAAAHVLNRRRDPRYEVDRPAQVRTELSSTTHDARLINYSKGGFCLLFDKPIELPHERLMLVVPAADKERNIAARVLWTGPALGIFAVGCAFSNMDGFVHLRDYAEPKPSRLRLATRPRSTTVSFTIAMAIVVTIALQTNWILQSRPEISAAIRASWSAWVVEPLRQQFESADEAG